MALSVRSRFEVFKRDEFTCKYCGQRSPEVVLEVDHIVPIAAGGTDDTINLITSCWQCNRGKSDKPLEHILTGEDPHDKAIELLERRRQVEEYNRVVAEEQRIVENDVWELVEFWNDENAIPLDKNGQVSTGKQTYYWLRSALQVCAKEKIREFMYLAFARGATRDMRYVAACVRNWRADKAAQEDVRALRDGKKPDGFDL